MLVFDTDSISIEPRISAWINFDDTIDLCIEPFYMDSISSIGIGNRYNTSFSSIGGEFSEMMCMSIPEFYEFLYSIL